MRTAPVGKSRMQQSVVSRKSHCIDLNLCYQLKSRHSNLGWQAAQYTIIKWRLYQGVALSN